MRLLTAGVLCFLLAVKVAKAQNQPAIPFPNQPSKADEPDSDDYVFKSATLEGRVKESLEQAKENQDLNPMGQLMSENKTDPDRVLVLLRPYLKNTNVDVQFCISEAATGQVKSREALPILSYYVLSPTTGHEAVRTIYNDYNADQVVKRGGRLLKSRLLQKAIADKDASHGYLLLSCFKNDPSITRFLQSRSKALQRLLSPQSKKNTATENLGGDGPVDPVTGAVTVDLALAELGDQQATARIQQMFQGQPVQQTRIALGYLKFVHNPSVLRGAVEQLKNKTEIEEMGLKDKDSRSLEHLRVCEQALKALRLRFDSPQPLKYETPRRFTDAELLAAYNKYSAMLAVETPTNRVIQSHRVNR